MTAFQDSIGVTSEEKVTNAITLGSNISSRNIGMAVERIRGVENVPTLTTSLKEDVKIFGGHSPNMYSSYVIESLFNNTGGYSANIYQVRIIGENCVAAASTIKNASANTQSLVSSTSQNSSGSQGQISKLVAGNVEVGDQFTVTISGTDDLGGTPTAFNHTYTYTAVAGEGVAEIIAALKADLDTFLATLTDTYGAVIASNELVISGPNNAPFTLTGGTTNEATSEAILKVTAGRFGKSDKGDWGNDLKVITYPIGHVNGSEEGYRMDVYYKGVRAEQYTSNGNEWTSIIDGVNQRSEYIMLTAVDTTKALTLSPSEAVLTGGVYNAPVEKDFEPYYTEVNQEPRGMAIFGGANVQIIACPEITSLNFAQLCNAFAEKHKKFFVFNKPYLATEAMLQTYYNGLLSSTQSYCSGFKQWMQVAADRDGNRIWIPVLGYVLGAGYVRAAGLNNGDPWTPPAGDETVAKKIFAFTDSDIEDTTLSRYVKKWKSNMIKFIEGTGFVIYSTRTYSTNQLFESVHIRLQTNWIIKNLEVRNEKAMNKLITTTAATKMRLDNLIWFKNLYEKGGIEDSIDFEDAVIIETEVSKENRKEMSLNISWIPPENLEHIHISLNRNDGILILNQ